MNILLLIGEQCKASALPLYGNRDFETRHLERLAAAGVTFNRPYCHAPLCGPARCSLFSGQYVHTHGCRMNFQVLNENHPNMVRPFREAGYLTAYTGVGGHHTFGGELKSDLLDVYHSTQPGELTEAVYHIPESAANDTANVEKGIAFGSGVFDYPEEEGITHQIADDVIRLLEGRAQPGHLDERPFFITAAFPDSHPPFWCPRPYNGAVAPAAVTLPPVPPDCLEGKLPLLKKYRRATGMDFATEDEVRRVIASYYGQILYLDSNLGRILDAVERSGCRDDTLVIFTADHGEYMGEFGLMRKNPYAADAMVRVPLVFSNPSLPRTPRRAALAQHVDIFPTVCEACGLAVPNGVSGVSLWPVLTGAKNEAREFAFSEPGVEGPYAEDEVTYWADYSCWQGRCKMVTDGHWKLMLFEDGSRELYDLASDPHELDNRINDVADLAVLERLEHALARWAFDTQALFPPLPERGVAHERNAARKVERARRKKAKSVPLYGDAGQDVVR